MATSLTEFDYLCSHRQEYFIFLPILKNDQETTIYIKLHCGYLGFGRPAGTALEFYSMT